MLQFKRCFLFCIVLYLSANKYRAFFFGHLRGTDKYPVRTVVGQMEMLFGDCCEPYIPVDAAKECKVGGDRGDILPGVVYTDSERVGRVERTERSDIECAGGISAVMFACFFTVDVDGSGLAGCIQSVYGDTSLFPGNTFFRYMHPYSMCAGDVCCSTHCRRKPERLRPRTHLYGISNRR